MSPQPFDERNGWKLYQHPAFRNQFDGLVAEVGRLQATLAPADFEHDPNVRLLARIRKLILDDIRTDPASKAYEQGNTLGTERRQWRRAKFNQRFRLFFRFRSAGKLIVYAWMNDENTLRARGARKDVYAVFEQHLKAGDPPDDWDALVAACDR